MQSIPRIVSTDADGQDEREFLRDYIADDPDVWNRIFLKGYQWPFDILKANGSSLIDLLIFEEIHIKGRRVWIDFRRNPSGTGFEFSRLSQEAQRYLAAAGVDDLDGTPLDRLRKMNEPAYGLFLNHSPRIDLASEMLEIDVRPQHNNGGLTIDTWWRSNLAGLFPVGEAAGSHGVYRPGGAALNGGQVGATRAAWWIANHETEEPVASDVFASQAAKVAEQALELLNESSLHSGDSTTAALLEIQASMNAVAGLVRDQDATAAALMSTLDRLANLGKNVAVNPASRISVRQLFLIRDVLISQGMYLTAISDYFDKQIGSRGSALYSDPSGAFPSLPDASGPLPASFAHRLADPSVGEKVQETRWNEGDKPVVTWRPVVPFVSQLGSFEEVWRTFRLAD